MSEAKPTGAERRLATRHPRTFEILWQNVGHITSERTTGTVEDISQTGVALRVDRPFPLKEILVLRLPTATQGWGTHLVRIMYCQQISEAEYKLGCQFHKPLSEEQLEQHLE
jgi:hypothetical protein